MIPQLNQSGKPQRSRAYWNDYPPFYQKAIDAEWAAIQAMNDASNRYIMAEYGHRKNELWKAWQRAEQDYIEARNKVYKMFDHWQTLIKNGQEPCSCTPERVCSSCKAQMRLYDKDYEPNLKEMTE